MSSGGDDPRSRQRALVARVLDGPSPAGIDFDACRAVLRQRPEEAMTFQALCRLLEGYLADPDADIGDVQVLVPLLKQLARGDLDPDQLL